jgi:hypothetical protein
VTPLEAVQRISEFECAVRVQKLARVTLIRDCNSKLWELLGLTRDQVFSCEGKMPQVLDFPFDIWMCNIGIKNPAKRITAYGRSFVEAVDIATNEMNRAKK